MGRETIDSILVILGTLRDPKYAKAPSQGASIFRELIPLCSLMFLLIVYCIDR